MRKNCQLSPVIFASLLKLTIRLDLNDGTGEACAGHVKLYGCPTSRMKLDVFDSSSNFGFDPPTGHVFEKYRNYAS